MVSLRHVFGSVNYTRCHKMITNDPITNAKTVEGYNIKLFLTVNGV